MKKKKIFLLFAITFFIAIVLLFIFTDREYSKYNSGVTIEVNNMSDEVLPDLKFLYSDNTDIGTLKSLSPGKTDSVIGSSKDIKVSDLSMHLNYYIDNGGKKNDNLTYIYNKEPNKVVIILNITEVDSHGYIKYQKKGYANGRKFGPEEMD